jgi:hypothetical protein
LSEIESNERINNIKTRISEFFTEIYADFTDKGFLNLKSDETMPIEYWTILETKKQYQGNRIVGYLKDYLNRDQKNFSNEISVNPIEENDQIPENVYFSENNSAKPRPRRFKPHSVDLVSLNDEFAMELILGPKTKDEFFKDIMKFKKLTLLGEFSQIKTLVIVTRTIRTYERQVQLAIIFSLVLNSMFDENYHLYIILPC